MTAPHPDYIAAALAVVEVLESQSIAYLIGGSVASGIHGMPRSTQDIDLVVELSLPQAAPFVHRLGTGFYVDLEAVEEAVRRHRSFNLIHLETMVKVDLFVAKEEAFVRSQMARRQRHVLLRNPERCVYVASPEDTILAKLAWYRSGGETSSSQWSDVLGVMKIQGSRLDKAYLEQWASRIGVADLLSQALQDSGLEPETPALSS